MGHRILYIPRPVNPIFYPEYGLLYNWYVATDTRKISSSDDWVVPTRVQWRALADYLGAAGNYYTNNVGGKLKETGLTHWASPNTSATNEVNFNAKPSGLRTETGAISSLTQQFRAWSSNNVSSNVYEYLLYYNIAEFDESAFNMESGRALRLLYVGAGTPTSYTGNDGKVYRVVTIGTQIWLADNLTETRFRNGDIIPWYGANSANYFTNAEWAALTTAGCCAYKNTLSNVAAGFSFPT